MFRSRRSLLSFSTTSGGLRIGFAAAMSGVALPDRMNAQSVSTSVGDIFSQHVYAWFPDNRVLRISPGVGLFAQACVHPKGAGAVFWGGTEGMPQIWYYDFALRKSRPVTAADSGSVEPAFDREGDRFVFASDTKHQDHLDLRQIAQSWKTRTYGYRANLNLFATDLEGTKQPPAQAGGVGWRLKVAGRG